MVYDKIYFYKSIFNFFLKYIILPILLYDIQIKPLLILHVYYIFRYIPIFLKLSEIFISLLLKRLNLKSSRKSFFLWFHCISNFFGKYNSFFIFTNL
ncbi:hypothetical protein A0H76_1750 [Hepatospora eriocheir]|uniref:Uncharacterized protein n=1 Tax=Hepatospora eriocheir TaxID=1081669 RepID=A0A1X0QGK9_9MICR|nr:hypothetical protein A0H76_1750 [Hepatospora eriocheir]